ncbi:MAG: hypothetical protein DWH82_05455 [Planctomycetota bacterium]|nr:MAG: hypothetical protein DWH82_05455 [Planctomycetota bacterium]
MMAIPFAVISQWELQVVNFAAAFTKGKAKKDYFSARKMLPGNCCFTSFYLPIIFFIRVGNMV